MTPDLVRRPRSSAMFLILTLVAVLLGDTMAFNQLATQSATDAIIPLLVVSIGVAAALEAVRRVVCGRRMVDVVLALSCAIVSALGWFAWAAYWPIVASAWIVVAAALLSGVATNVAPLVSATAQTTLDPIDGGTDDEPRGTLDLGGVIAVLGLVQTVVLTYFALLAFLDAPTGPFG